MRARRIAAAAAGLLMTTGLTAAQGTVAQAATTRVTAPCEGTYTIVVGGTGSKWWDDGFRGNIQQHVGYPTDIPNGASTRAGVNELNRLVRDQRAACPGQHVKMAGYSLGAGVVHVWVSENWRTFDNVNAILVSDPKRQGPPGANGGAVPFGGLIGYPLAGADRNFGNVPVKTICNWDYVCDESAGIWTYPANHVNNYNVDRDMDHHNDSANEEWYNGVWHPASW
ncbi:cutinase family protein [Kitasatospora sp. NPDC057904]|uniref:cutinase family protein n=1 Tax=unclassified Kitasatospora TaxID=2633591 RepID=UPI0036D95FFF